MEWWLNITMMDTDHLVPIARMAEECGFAGLSMGDHLFFPETITSRYPYTADGKPGWTGRTHWADSWVAIATMAAHTSRLRFNTGIYIAPLRDPFSLAKSVSTTARMTGNRLLVGFGAGWMKEEFDIVGTPFEGRGARFDEMLTVMKLLWSGEMVSHEGKFYNFPPIQMSPVPPAPVPIYIGGLNDAALKRAARNGGWVGVHETLESSAALIGKIREYEALYPGVGPCRILMNGYQVKAAEARELVDLGVEATVLPLPPAAYSGDLTKILDSIRRKADDLNLG
jgi:probable F420-dependent oxidoreductase